MFYKKNIIVYSKNQKSFVYLMLHYELWETWHGFLYVKKEISIIHESFKDELKYFNFIRLINVFVQVLEMYQREKVSNIIM